MFIKFLVGASAAAVFAAGASAAPAAPRSAAADGGTMRYEQATGRYCLRGPAVLTGTRLNRSECRTAAQWKAEGLTVTRR